MHQNDQAYVTQLEKIDGWGADDMKSLVQGQNTPLSGNKFRVSVGWKVSAAQAAVDLSAFLLATTSKVRSDEDMIFYGQPRSVDGSIAINSSAPSSDGGVSEFSLDVSSLAADVEKIAFTATTPADSSPPLSTIESLHIKVTPENDAVDACEFVIDTRNAPEAAMILGEVYRRAGDWKFRAVGQGFVGGLAPLAEHYGVVVDDPGTSAPPYDQASPGTSAPPIASAPSASSAPASTPAPVSSPASASAPVPAVNLSKVSLSKAKPSVSLEKRGASLGQIRVNLDWTQKVDGKGLFGQAKKTSIDLDLSCLFLLDDGGKGAIQALGSNFGSYENIPWIHLLGDDRTGSTSGGEWLHINGARWDNIQRLVIFALIYEGVPNWSATDGVVSLHVPDQPIVESRLEGESKHRVCAVATLENDKGRLKMTQENRYFESAKELDEHYGIGLNWTAGTK